MPHAAIFHSTRAIVAISAAAFRLAVAIQARERAACLSAVSDSALDTEDAVVARSSWIFTGVIAEIASGRAKLSGNT